MKPDRESAATEVAITVVRTGGFAGIPRRWAVRATAADAAPWIDLIDRCPWDAAQPASAAVDRFSWTLHAVRDGGEHHSGHREDHHAELAESEIEGPWRTLIDAVREEAARSVAPTEQ